MTESTNDNLDYSYFPTPASLDHLYRRQRLIRRLWRYGTIALAFEAASSAGNGELGQGMDAIFPVVFGSLFLNWSLFARFRLVRWVGWLSLAATGAITTGVLVGSAGVAEPLRWLLVGLAGVVLASARVYLDRLVPEPVYWYRLGVKADPF